MGNIIRKERRKMVSKNKVKKYAIYAIGEIILVVIGILIALKINALDKEYQNKDLEITYLASMKADLLIQKETLLEQVDNEMIMIEKSDSCIGFASSNLSLLDLSNKLDQLTLRRTFIATMATFNNGGAVGEIVIIKDPVLQNAIVRYYQQLEYTRTVVNNNNLFLVDNQFGTFVTSNALGFRLDKNGNMDLTYEMQPEQLFRLKSQLLGRNRASRSIKRICVHQLEETERLIKTIENYLKEN